MTPVLLIRHAETSWNAEGRIQGRTDVPLSPAGRSALAGRSLPASFSGHRWYSSPLRRAVETAALLGAGNPRLEPRLAEMAWGEWEGCRVSDLRRRLGPGMLSNESQGLDFQPPGGESPRMVQERVAAWFGELVEQGGPVVGVTHKGVIRAVQALATGWDMTAKPPLKIDWTCAQLFTLDGQGRPAVGRLNIPLVPARGIDPATGAGVPGRS